MINNTILKEKKRKYLFLKLFRDSRNKEKHEKM